MKRVHVTAVAMAATLLLGTVGWTPTSAASDQTTPTTQQGGIGIPQTELDWIFRKFYRGGDASTGTGLGLFIAQGLVTAMGGRISVHSEEGKGSQFSFELRVADGSVVEAARPRV